ncbi:tetratricopeptide repeat protein [Aquimarina megaterium]|uniref:tetratricopeptide repeat protein n=1 Tax=Aquimarina megaterium TaxID=1443666 RepID=UPI0004724FAD|nr:tetratricopeptide repeat protein [Aquimarina megaterium]
MKFDKEIYDQIDAYVKGAMNEDEKLLFEKKMQSNDLLKEEVELNKSVKASINAEEWVLMNSKTFLKEDISKISSYRRSSEFMTMKNTIQESADQFFDKKYSKPKTNNRKWIYYASTIAAVFLIFLIMKFTGNQDLKKLYSVYSDWDQLPSLIVQSDTDQELAKATLLFEDQKYEEAISAFNRSIEQTKRQGNTEMNPYVFSYLGISHLELENYQKALEYFDQLQQSGMVDYSRAYWYKALLYIKKSDVLKAKEQLILILKDDKNYNYEKAKEVLEKLL